MLSVIVLLGFAAVLIGIGFFLLSRTYDYALHSLILFGAAIACVVIVAISHPDLTF